MQPVWLKSKIFLDSGDPEETRKAVELMGFLDGQTTNPTLVAKNPEVKERLERGEKFSRKELLDFYKKIVLEISKHIPFSSVSIETYADHETTVGEILEQAKEMSGWIPNAHIKMPITKAGLEAAKQAVRLGLKVNMTLCFSQEQAGAVYMATQGAKRRDILISPFIGRLDDTGLMGVDLVRNITRMLYDRIHPSDEHVQVLAASIRHLDHFMHVIRSGVDSVTRHVDIITSPLRVLEEWAKAGFPKPDPDFCYDKPELKRIPYEPYINFARNWYDFKITHPLTDKGIELFSNDWNALIKKE